MEEEKELAYEVKRRKRIEVEERIQKRRDEQDTFFAL
jgi:hypothetical protein